MASLLDQRSAIKLMRAHGWTRGTGGRHVVKMTKAGHRPVTLPRHHGQAYDKRLTSAIIRQAALNKEDVWTSRSTPTPKGRATGRRSESFRDASRQAER